MKGIGGPELRTISGIHIVDNGQSGASQRGLLFGWVFIRVIAEITPARRRDLDAIGLKFTTQNMVQRGWYHMHITESVARQLSSYSDVIRVFKYQRPHDIRQLSAEPELLVRAAPDWCPSAPGASIRRYMDEDHFIVRGISAAELANDPDVDDIVPVPKVVLN